MVLVIYGLFKSAGTITCFTYFSVFIKLHSVSRMYKLIFVVFMNLKLTFGYCYLCTWSPNPGHNRLQTIAFTCKEEKIIPKGYLVFSRPEQTKQIKMQSIRFDVSGDATLWPSGPKTTLTRKKKYIYIYNNLKFYIYLPFKKFLGPPWIFFMPIKLNFGP